MNFIEVQANVLRIFTLHISVLNRYMYWFHISQPITVSLAFPNWICSHTFRRVPISSSYVRTYSITNFITGSWAVDMTKQRIWTALRNCLRIFSLLSDELQTKFTEEGSTVCELIKKQQISRFRNQTTTKSKSITLQHYIYVYTPRLQ